MRQRHMAHQIGIFGDRPDRMQQAGSKCYKNAISLFEACVPSFPPDARRENPMRPHIFKSKTCDMRKIMSNSEKCNMSNPTFRENQSIPWPGRKGEMHGKRRVVGLDRGNGGRGSNIEEGGYRGKRSPRKTMRVRTLPPVIVVGNVGPRGGGKEAIGVRIRVGGHKARRGPDSIMKQ